MYYSALEQHKDGSFWYHGHTFENKEDAEKFVADWISWDPGRIKKVFEHKKPLPDQTCCTFDFKHFGFAGAILWAE